jgi:hypothetical protein
MSERLNRREKRQRYRIRTRNTTLLGAVNTGWCEFLIYNVRNNQLGRTIWTVARKGGLRLDKRAAEGAYKVEGEMLCRQVSVLPLR